MAGPWEKYQTQPSVTPVEEEAQGPWTKFKTPTETEVLAGEDPLMKGLDENREEAATQVVAPTSRQTQGLRSQEDLYGSVDEKYSDVPPGVHPFDEFQMDDRQRTSQALREQEKMDTYNRTGRESTVMGVPVRVQTERKNNPNYDPSMPESETNSPFVEKDFLVDRPDSNALRRVAYQVMENIVGGVGDFVTEGKLLAEGDIGKALPDTVPGGEGEQLVSELTTFIAGPAAITKGVKAVGKGVGMLTGQVAKALTPEAVSAIKGTYDTVLKATGSVAKAHAAATGMSKKLVVGLAFGLEEAMVAPDGSQGLVEMALTPEFVSETFGISKERAKDIAFVLDSPVISGTLNSLGGLYSLAKDKFIAPTFGGLRSLGNTDIPIAGSFARNLTTNRITISQKDAGLRVITWLDPNLKNTSPEEFIFRTNLLSGALDRSATKNVQLQGANREINLDTPAAFVEVAKDYYSLAYSHLKETLGEREFNEFVSMQASETANRLYELRTAIVADPNVATQTARSSQSLSELFDEVSGNTPDGTLPGMQEQMGEILGGVQTGRLNQADQMVNDATATAENSRAVARTAISDDPEVKQLFDDFTSDVGSDSAINARLKETVSEPMYRSFKKLKTETDEAYNTLYNAGAEGNPAAIMEIIGKEGSEDPFLKSIAESANADPSFKNIHNTLKAKINKQISALQGKPEMQDRLDKLYQLRDNITGTEPGSQLDFLSKNEDGDVVDLANAAKEKYITLKTSWGDEQSLDRLTQTAGKARLRGEQLPAGVGPGQGVTNWDINAVRTVQDGLDGPTSEIFRQSLDRAATAGGEDVSKGIVEYATAKSLNNIAGRISKGNKESAGTLLQGLGSYATLLDNMNSPLLGKVRSLQAKIETLGNAADLDEKSLKMIQGEAAKITQEAEKSILNKFIKGRENLAGADVDGVVKNIFNSPTSVTDLHKLVKEADVLGAEGPIIKEALQNTWLDHIKGKIFSNRSISVSDINNGMLTQGYKVNDINVKKIFANNSREMANMRILFADTPEVFDQIKDVAATLQNITRTTTKNEGLLKQPLEKSSDPVQGTNSLIQFTLGVLNSTATRAKRLIGPMAADNLEQVKQAQEAIMMAMITDPKAFAEIAKGIAKGVNHDQQVAKFRSIITRGYARSVTSDEPPIQREMDSMK